MRKLQTAALFVFFVGMLTAAADERKLPSPAKLTIDKTAGDLSGIYHVVGIETNGKKYTTVATIQRRGDGYVVIWTMGEINTIGIGLRQSDTLSVGWTQPLDGKLVRGVTVYKVALENGNPKLTGRWMSMAFAGIANESLTFLKANTED